VNTNPDLMGGYLKDLAEQEVSMKKLVDRHIVSFQSEPFRKGRRYHWMICSSMTPDELVSWGHASTQELAEQTAQNELRDLSSRLAKGGRVTSQSRAVTH
jgi:hypothetical protein